jgi:membrane-associated phospholipid phosphatase
MIRVSGIGRRLAARAARFERRPRMREAAQSRPKTAPLFSFLPDRPRIEPRSSESAADVLERPLIHEILWAGFGGVMALRLGLAGHLDLAVGIYLAALLPHAILIVRGCMLARRSSSALWQRIRLLYPFLLMNLLYQATRTAVPALGLPTWDVRLLTAERWLLGFDPRLELDRQLGWAYTPPISEIFSISYMLLFVLLIASIVREARGTLRRQAAFSSGLWSAYAVGLLGYTLVPARGPYVAFAEIFQHPVAGWIFTDFNRQLVAAGAPGFDVFPSLHVAASAFLLLWHRRTSPRWFRVSLVPVVLLWLSTIYLRYHYVVDLIAGAALAAVCLAAAFRGLPNRSRR